MRLRRRKDVAERRRRRNPLQAVLILFHRKYQITRCESRAHSDKKPRNYVMSGDTNTKNSFWRRRRMQTEEFLNAGIRYWNVGNHNLCSAG